MKARAEVIAAAIITALAAAYLAHNTVYPLGTLAAPGAGIFPLVVGAAVLVLGAMELGQAIIRYRACLASGDDISATSACAPTYDERRPMLLAVLMVLYVWLLEPIGFVTTTVFLVVACTKLMGTRGWRRPLLLAAGLCLSCYIVFELWLRLSLPHGLIF